MFNLIPPDWGGYAKHWIREIAVNLPYLEFVHLRRMVVSDEDLLTLAKERRHMLRVLKLDTCSGFSTTGLEAITRSCRSMRELHLSESTIDDNDGKWLHELALHNSSLEVLNFSSTSIENVDVEDLDTLARNCANLRSLKVNAVDLNKLRGLLSRATALKELGGVVISGEVDDTNGGSSEVISLPKSLTSLSGFMYMGEDNGDTCVNLLIQPIALGLRELDLQMTALSIAGHCQLLRHCSNLEVLEVLNGIGDDGLDVVANNCKKLRRLRVESGDREFQQGYVTQRGVISIARCCQNLEYIALYVSDINNAALKAMGEGCPKLKDFRVVLLDDKFEQDSPLDLGVRALLVRCPDLTRIALYLKPGSLTDKGMSYIGKFGCKLKWALLGLIGETDAGFSWLADGCPKLERLEMRDCVFTEAGISRAVMKMDSLKYVWVQGYKATSQGQALHAMTEHSWNIEFIPEQRHTRNVERDLEHANLQFQEVCDRDKEPAQFLAYRSLAGKRRDYPETILCFP